MIGIDFEVYCSCGNGERMNANACIRQGDYIVYVEPCKDCLKKARKEGEAMSDGIDP